MLLERRGRTSDKQNNTILITATPEMKDWVRSQADKDGRSMSYYLNQLILEKMQELKVDEK